MHLQSRTSAAMLGVAIGDALGATLEFMLPAEIKLQHGEHSDLSGGGWLRLKPGQVTDDTGMTLALGDAILAKQGKVDALACAQSFDAWMRARPVDIGNTVRRGIVQFRLHGQTAAPYSDEAAGNGAIMRCLPMAIVTYGASQNEIQAAWQAQAHLTHNNQLSDQAGTLLIRLLHGAFSGMDKRTLLHQIAHAFVAEHPKFNFRRRIQENPSGYVVDTMQAVLQAFFDTHSFEECLIDVVNRGGDADTTGAIAGMLAGAHYGTEALPPRWFRQLDPIIREHCMEQSRLLTLLSPAMLRRQPS